MCRIVLIVRQIILVNSQLLSCYWITTAALMLQCVSLNWQQNQYFPKHVVSQMVADSSFKTCVSTSVTQAVIVQTFSTEAVLPPAAAIALMKTSCPPERVQWWRLRCNCTAINHQRIQCRLQRVAYPLHLLYVIARYMKVIGGFTSETLLAN